LASSLTAREFGDRLGLEHLEVIRRIRKGDIKATKWGWNWAIPASEVEAVKHRDWYQKIQVRRARPS
jgi:hypothetical protein